MAMRYACAPFLTDDDFGTLIRCDCDLAGLDVTEIIEQVSDLLAMFSNGAVRGRCTGPALRPCAQESSCVCGSDGWADACHCCRIDGIPLPGVDPSVVSVTIDGIPLEPDEWVIVDSKLVRVSGSWPGCQRLTLPATEVGTFEIVVAHGFLPLFARMAAAELTCEIALQLAVAQGQTPPANWTAANLDGLTVSRDRYATDPLAAVDQFMALGLQWTAKFLNAYADSVDAPNIVWSVEGDDGWRFHTFAAGE